MKVLAPATALAVAALHAHGHCDCPGQTPARLRCQWRFDFWKAAEAGMAKAQAELPDYTLSSSTRTSRRSQQQALMDNLATAGVKAIMVSAVDPKATDVLDKNRR